MITESPQGPTSCLDKDRETTLLHRRMIGDNPNLLHWYSTLYDLLVDKTGYRPGRRVLEVGSGASVLSTFYPEIMTSDILQLDGVRFQLDGQRLDEYPELPHGGLDGIVMTNVLHHMREPLKFFRSAARALKPGGKICLLEPYHSLLGAALYRSTQFLHKEGIDFSATEPVILSYDGPLSSANMALPQLILIEKRFFAEVERDYLLEPIEHYTSLAYFVTGGAKRHFRIPRSLYQGFFRLDRKLATRFPRFFATFFIACLEKKQPPCLSS